LNYQRYQKLISYFQLFLLSLDHLCLHRFSSKLEVEIEHNLFWQIPRQSIPKFNVNLAGFVWMFTCEKRQPAVSH
jgi:hypothetical protein